MALRVRAMAIGPESVIAGYRLVSLIGRGGMGVVYEAVQLTLGRPVALKLVDPARVDDEELRVRFVRESHIAAGLEHPHVIPVYEAREDDGLLFIAMRLVQGPSLADVLAAQAPLPPVRAATIVAQIASALGAAHAKGLVHRDVKPANVLLHEGEHAYLTDFGITREISASDGLTAVGERIGTVDYMSPEQARGEAVGPAADIYALGCVLYETLTGRVPFAEGGEAMRLSAHLHDAPPIASRHWPSVPAELDLVILTALAKDPAQRHARRRGVRRRRPPRRRPRAGDAGAPEGAGGAADPGRPGDDRLGLSARSTRGRSTPFPVPRRRWILACGLATVAGLALLQLDGTVVEAVGAVLVGLVLTAAIGLIVVRLGPQSDSDRDREALAREEFERTGSWPAE